MKLSGKQVRRSSLRRDVRQCSSSRCMLDQIDSLPQDLIATLHDQRCLLHHSGPSLAATPAVDQRIISTADPSTPRLAKQSFFITTTQYRTTSETLSTVMSSLIKRLPTAVGAGAEQYICLWVLSNGMLRGRLHHRGPWMESGVPFGLATGD